MCLLSVHCVSRLLFDIVHIKGAFTSSSFATCFLDLDLFSKDPSKLKQGSFVSKVIVLSERFR